MASDTATLDLERVDEERRRLESGRNGGRGRVRLGPEDRAPADALDTGTDPATRAHRIVQEVLSNAEHREEARERGVDVDLPEAASGPAAAHARRIVEEVLAAATDASPTGADASDDDTGPALEVRADLVLLGVPQPMVLLPGVAYEPSPPAFQPSDATAAATLEALVAEAFAPLTTPARDTSARDTTDADGLVTPATLGDALRGAAESSNVHGVRWIVAGAVWALAFALVAPIAFKGVLSSVDMTLELWDDAGETVVAEPQVDVPEEELPPADPAAPDG